MTGKHESHDMHGGADPSRTLFRSVGIDVGSSTTHLTFSELVVGRRDPYIYRKPEVLERRVTYRSPILLTPFTDPETIDTERIAAFVEGCYTQAGVEARHIDAGAVICTGEAARRHNARSITERLARDSGRFVCATAGHHFEATLAAHGSGAIELSHHLDGIVVNLDLGGGTTKRTAIRKGVILDTAAINVGARLVAVDEHGIVARAEPAALAIARSIGLELVVGHRLERDGRDGLVRAMQTLLMEFLGFLKLSPLAHELLLTPPPRPVDDSCWVVCSGGVSEYVYGRSAEDPGDLGPTLGPAVRDALLRHLPVERLVEPNEGIRATVIGASQFSLQVSGETVYISDRALLPVHNVPVVVVPLDWQTLTSESVELMTERAMRASEQDGSLALFFGAASRFGYGNVQPLAEGIAAALSARNGHEAVVLAFGHNIANTLGRALRQALPPAYPFICLDELQLGNLEYVDIGVPPHGQGYFPVVVKSLVFQQVQASRR